MSQKESKNQIQSISLALQGLLLGVLLIYPALLSLSIFGVRFGFVFLPVVAIYYWPRQASYSWSLICVFSLGLLYDLISAGPFGVWTLSLLALYLVLSTGESIKTGLMRGVLGYTLCVAFIFALVSIIGRVFVGHWPILSALFLNAVTSIAVFPLLYWLRSIAKIVRGSSEVSGVRG